MVDRLTSVMRSKKAARPSTAPATEIYCAIHNVATKESSGVISEATVAIRRSGRVR
jgi:hypothetical protein